MEDNGMQCRPNLKERSQFKHRSTDMMKLEVISLEIKKNMPKTIHDLKTLRDLMFFSQARAVLQEVLGNRMALHYDKLTTIIITEKVYSFIINLNLFRPEGRTCNCLRRNYDHYLRTYTELWC
jgi:hypothetical protein